LDFFPGVTFLIRESNAYFFSKYPLFYGIGDAYFKGCLIVLPNVPGATFISGATFIPESRVHAFMKN
jgi:hypothetical protein